MTHLGRHEWIYVIDASSWIAIESHPAQNRILSALVPLIQNGRVKMPPEAWRELENTSYLAGWLEPYKSAVVENLRTDVDYLLLAGQISHKFPGMAGARGTRDKADPWIVAMAKHMTGKPHARAVVCNETLERRPNRKIPTACKHFGVICMN